MEIALHSPLSDINDLLNNEQNVNNLFTGGYSVYSADKTPRYAFGLFRHKWKRIKNLASCDHNNLLVSV
jgi:hypothetical protein